MAQKIAFFDLDGTFFRWQLYLELVFELKDRGVFSTEVAELLNESFVAWQGKQSPWRDFEITTIQAFESALGDLETSVFDEAAQAVVSRSGHRIYNYTKQLLNTLKQEGYFTLAISGSQQEIAEPFAKKYGFDDCIGAVYERRDTRFTGNISRYVPGRKHEIIQHFMDSNPGIALEGSVAIGDSEGDISMLDMVDRPIAFNPSVKLMEEAQKKGWEIVIERKSLAYTLKKGSDGSYILAQTDSY